MQSERQAGLDALHEPTSEDLRAQAAELIRDGRLEDAAMLLARGRRSFPDDVHLLLDQATLAETTQDWDGALELLERAIDRLPETEEAYRRAAALCRKLDRPNEAEMILVHGMCRFPTGLDLFAEYAAIAEARQDRREAARRAQLLCERFPLHGPAHARLAAALKKAGRSQDAERALLHGQGHFPQDPYWPIEHAELAAEREDWAEAARRFDAARERHPETWWVRKRLADMLKRAGRTAEAEAVLLDGQASFPNEPGLFLDHADLAADEADWTLALRRLEAVRDRFPDFWWPCKRMADILKAAGRTDDAEAALLDFQRRFPRERDLFLDYAELAVEKADWAEAQRRFEAVRDRFPDFWWSFKRLGDILKLVGRIADAEAVLLDGQSRFPQEAGLFFDHAELAAGADDQAETLRRFAALQDRFPDLWWSTKRIAETLKLVGRIAEAEAVLLDGQSRLPQEAGLFFDYAELAAERKDWTEALRRFEVIRSKFPGLWGPFRRIAQTLRELQRFDDAERVIVAGMDLFPDDPAMFFDLADLHQWTGRIDTAIEGYRTIRERFPDNYWGYLLLSRALAAARRFDEMESMLVETMRAFPDGPGPLVELIHLTVMIPADVRQVSFAALDEMVDGWIGKLGETEELLLVKAQLLQLGGDYQGSLRQLMHLAQVHPGARLVEVKIAAIREILLGRGEAVPGDFDDFVVPPPDADDVPQTKQELLSRFESLGGGGPGESTHYGCEFGFVQRHVTLEPLSLLRWSGVTLANVTRLLANDFEGVGDVDISILNSVEGYYDWHFVDMSYELRCEHTHLDRLTVPREEALQMMCQRFRFLARKLREDLEDGEKIFVYRYSGQIEDETGMLALAAAANRFGKNMIFFVCRADEHHAPLTVRLVHPGLMVGYLDWFALDRLGYPVNIDGWMALCDQGFRLWRSQRQPG